MRPVDEACSLSALMDMVQPMRVRCDMRENEAVMCTAVDVMFGDMYCILYQRNMEV